jgi:hypothetical protein
LKFPKWHCSAVAKEKGETRLARQILADVVKEMNKPVMTASVKRFLADKMARLSRLRLASDLPP